MTADGRLDRAHSLRRGQILSAPHTFERGRTLDRRALAKAAWLTVALAACVALRTVATRSGALDGVTVGIAFGIALSCVAVVGGLPSGWRLRFPRPFEVAIGVAGGAALVAIALVDRDSLGGFILRGGAQFAPWAAATIVVASAEELLLRGALFGALERAAGVLAAVALTTLLFALMHVPFYGWQALPLDLGVGLAFGGLRLLSGGVVAPAVAHVIADLATWWL